MFAWILLFSRMKFQILRARLVEHFSNMFSVFKQHYTHFHTFFPHAYFKKIQTTLLKFLYQTGPKTSEKPKNIEESYDSQLRNY